MLRVMIAILAKLPLPDENRPIKFTKKLVLPDPLGATTHIRIGSFNPWRATLGLNDLGKKSFGIISYRFLIPAGFAFLGGILYITIFKKFN